MKYNPEVKRVASKQSGRFTKRISGCFERRRRTRLLAGRRSRPTCGLKSHQIRHLQIESGRHPRCHAGAGSSARSRRRRRRTHRAAAAGRSQSSQGLRCRPAPFRLTGSGRSATGRQTLACPGRCASGSACRGRSRRRRGRIGIPRAAAACQLRSYRCRPGPPALMRLQADGRGRSAAGRPTSREFQSPDSRTGRPGNARCLGRSLVAEPGGPCLSGAGRDPVAGARGRRAPASGGEGLRPAPAKDSLVVGPRSAGSPSAAAAARADPRRSRQLLWRQRLPREGPASASASARRWTDLLGRRGRPRPFRGRPALIRLWAARRGRSVRRERESIKRLGESSRANVSAKVCKRARQNE